MPKSPSAFDAWGYQSTQMAPSPKNTRANVPMNSAVSFCGKLYIKEPPGPGTKRARCDREGFYLERKEKRQPFGEWVVGKFPIAALVRAGQEAMIQKRPASPRDSRGRSGVRCNSNPPALPGRRTAERWAARGTPLQRKQ